MLLLLLLLLPSTRAAPPGEMVDYSIPGATLPGMEASSSPWYGSLLHPIVTLPVRFYFDAAVRGAGVSTGASTGVHY